MHGKLHEIVVSLLKENPRVLVELLGERPEFAQGLQWSVSVADAETSKVDATPLRSDMVAELRSDAGTVEIVVEVQLRRDARKPAAWAMYVAALAHRKAAPVLLVVVTSKASVARWAAGPFRSPCLTLTPIVLGPEQMPALQSPADVAANLELATLTLLLRAADDAMPAFVARYVEVLTRLDDPRAGMYFDHLLSAASGALKQELEDQMRPGKWEPRSDLIRPLWFRAKAEGKAEGKAEMLLTIASARGLSFTPTQRATVLAANEATLDRWTSRVLVVGSADELFDPDIEASAKRGAGWDTGMSWGDLED